jgi:hypothetical protein
MVRRGEVEYAYADHVEPNAELSVDLAEVRSGRGTENPKGLSSTPSGSLDQSLTIEVISLELAHR